MVTQDLSFLTLDIGLLASNGYSHVTLNPLICLHFPQWSHHDLSFLTLDIGLLASHCSSPVTLNPLIYLHFPRLSRTLPFLEAKEM